MTATLKHNSTVSSLLDEDILPNCQRTTDNPIHLTGSCWPSFAQESVTPDETNHLRQKSTRTKHSKGPIRSVNGLCLFFPVLLVTGFEAPTGRGRIGDRYFYAARAARVRSPSGGYPRGTVFMAKGPYNSRIRLLFSASRPGVLKPHDQELSPLRMPHPDREIPRGVLLGFGYRSGGQRGPRGRCPRGD